MAEIDTLLRVMVQKKASDLHFCTGCRPILRLDGQVAGLQYEIISPQMARTMLYEIMPKRNEEEFNRTHDTDFAYEIPEIGRFRVNVYMDRLGVCGVFRVIPSKILTLEDLKLPESIKKLCTLKKGLVLVTGPTGSGKSTTLAAMIDYINSTRSEHIITIEDPLEFVHNSKRCLVNQREVYNHTSSFSAALRSALREDPDIVLVGEMRDLETTHIAIETAETGHLVFGTLHTTTAISTVDRLIDQFPSSQQAQIRTMLASSLKGVIAQNLLRKIGGGRVAALEIMIVNSAVSSLIRESKLQQIMSIMQTGKKEGMTILNQELANLVQGKIVSVEDAYWASVDKGDFVKRLPAIGINFTPPED